MLRGLDFNRPGPRVKVLKPYDNGRVDVVYLDDDPDQFDRKEAGFSTTIWHGYAGFIPKSVERKEDTVSATKN